MAAKLQCEICGGKLVGRPGGIFECDSCGMEYDTAWAKAKIQEITGTVKVEGTVEVTGKVQIDGPVKVEGGSVQVEGTANAASFLRRGELALEDGKWDEAVQYYDKALDAEPENVNAYLGKLLAKNRRVSIEKLSTADRVFDQDPDYLRALRFGDEKLKAALTACAEANREYVAKAKADAEQAKRDMEAARKAAREAREAQIRAKEEAKVNYLKSVLPSVGGSMGVFLARDHYTSAYLMSNGTVKAGCSLQKAKFIDAETDKWKDIVAVTVGTGFCAGIKEDGTVLVGGDDTCHVKKAENWSDIVAVAAGNYHLVGLKKDGTVVAEGYPFFGKCKVNDWRCVVAIAAGHDHTVGLKTDGTVVATRFPDDDYKYYKKQCEVGDWRDIVAIAAGGDHTIGLKKDGTVVAVGDNSSGACSVEDWTDIVAISTSDTTTLGLKPDGTVVSTRNKMDWKNIVALGQGTEEGLCLDGRTTSGKTLFFDFETEWNRVKEREDRYKKAIVEKEEAARKAREAREQEEAARRKAAEEEAERSRQQRIKELSDEKSALEKELSALTGLFTGKRRKEIETRMAQISSDLGHLKKADKKN